jgi:hypothetical protein
MDVPMEKLPKETNTPLSLLEPVKREEVLATATLLGWSVVTSPEVSSMWISYGGKYVRIICNTNLVNAYAYFDSTNGLHAYRRPHDTHFTRGMLNVLVEGLENGLTKS